MRNSPRPSFLLGLLALLSSCSPLLPPSLPFASPPRETGLHILSWNLLSLFDGIEDGDEYPDFSLEGGSWSEALYLRRLELLAPVILGAGGPSRGDRVGPEIACLLEVEKESILEDLARGPLARARYRFRAFAKMPGSAIGSGVLSRLPIKEARAWGLALGSRVERPILELRISLGRADLLLFVCHWKSKLEGAEATEPARREAATFLGELIQRRQRAEPGLVILACGDFNENPDEFSRRGRRYPTAFMEPAVETRVQIATARKASGSGSIILGSRSETLEALPPSSILFSPWSESAPLSGGSKSSGDYSYLFRGERERIDGFLLGPALLDSREIEFRSFKVIKGELVNEEGRPLGWKSAGASGWSDHLPLLLELGFVKEASP